MLYLFKLRGSNHRISLIQRLLKYLCSKISLTKNIRTHWIHLSCIHWRTYFQNRNKQLSLTGRRWVLFPSFILARQKSTIVFWYRSIGERTRLPKDNSLPWIVVHMCTCICCSSIKYVHVMAYNIQHYEILYQTDIPVTGKWSKFKKARQ